jgi:hypothetical protein
MLLETRLGERELLALWEHALPLPDAARAAALARALDASAPRTVGEQQRRLLRLLLCLAGPQLPLRAACPHCGEAASFDADLLQLLQALPEATAAADAVAVGAVAVAIHELHSRDWTLRFRLPTPDDVAANPACDDPVAALVARCVLHAEQGGHRVTTDGLPTPVLDALSARMDELDPGAQLAFTVPCPACGATWSSAFDPGRALWPWLQSAAERVLLTIDALACRYGWTEDQVLALSPTRRNAYLQLAGAE